MANNEIMALNEQSEEERPIVHVDGVVPVDAKPVGYLRILKQEEFEQIDYPVYEGKHNTPLGVRVKF